MTASHSRPHSIDRAALLSSAVASVVDAGLPGLTWVDRGLPKTETRKTNPPRSQADSSGSVNPPNRIARPPGFGSRPVDARLPGLTVVNRGLPNPQKCKTNPPASAGPDPSLTEQKLAA